MFSKKENSGVIVTPHWPAPYPPGVVCTYYVTGLMNYQDLEKVRLTFNSFNIS